MNTVTFQNGTKEISLTITGDKIWESADKASVRKYFDLSCTDKRLPVSKIYEVLAGTTRDKVIKVCGRTFAYEYGMSADSKTKRAAIDDAVSKLISNI